MSSLIVTKKLRNLPRDDECGVDFEVSNPILVFRLFFFPLDLFNSKNITHSLNYEFVVVHFFLI
jgi:hypothetical protein